MCEMCISARYLSYAYFLTTMEANIKFIFNIYHNFVISLVRKWFEFNPEYISFTRFVRTK